MRVFSPLPPFAVRAGALPSVLAMDCEMCETTDPVTGSVDGNTLVRISIINGHNPSEVSTLLGQWGRQDGAGRGSVTSAYFPRVYPECRLPSAL